MPYTSTADLPDAVRLHLPQHAREIFRAAFNNASDEYGGDEERAFRIAWAAVKRQYHKVGDEWVPIE
ncbi:MAG: ChaB family protein [Stellaceae bacterium]